MIRGLLRPLFAIDGIKLPRWVFVALMLLAAALAWLGKSPRRRPASAVLLLVVHLVPTAATTHSQGSRIIPSRKQASRSKPVSP